MVPTLVHMYVLYIEQYRDNSTPTIQNPLLSDHILRYSTYVLTATYCISQQHTYIICQTVYRSQGVKLSTFSPYNCIHTISAPLPGIVNIINEIRMYCIQMKRVYLCIVSTDVLCLLLHCVYGCIVSTYVLCLLMYCVY